MQTCDILPGAPKNRHWFIVLLGRVVTEWRWGEKCNAFLVVNVKKRLKNWLTLVYINQSYHKNKNKNQYPRFLEPPVYNKRESERDVVSIDEQQLQGTA